MPREELLSPELDFGLERLRMQFNGQDVLLSKLRQKPIDTQGRRTDLCMGQIQVDLLSYCQEVNQGMKIALDRTHLLQHYKLKYITNSPGFERRN